MDPEQKEQLRKDIEKVLKERLKTDIEECRLNKEFNRAFDEYGIVHTVEGPDAWANEVIHLLEKKELI